jgi:hypothetical protein
LDSIDTPTHIGFGEDIPGCWKQQGNDGLELNVQDMKTGTIQDVQPFPLLLEPGEMLNDVTPFFSTELEQSMLDSNSGAICQNITVRTSLGDKPLFRYPFPLHSYSSFFDYL